LKDAGSRSSRRKPTSSCSTKRDIRQFAADCRAKGIEVARPFPPLTTHARVTIGTMDEMKKASQVMRQVLSASNFCEHFGHRGSVARLAARRLRRDQWREC
jgi:hypothetical protein